jgi:hypothetical protein
VRGAKRYVVSANSETNSRRQNINTLNPLLSHLTRHTPNPVDIGGW